MLDRLCHSLPLLIRRIFNSHHERNANEVRMGAARSAARATGCRDRRPCQLACTHRHPRSLPWRPLPGILGRASISNITNRPPLQHLDTSHGKRAHAHPEERALDRVQVACPSAPAILVAAQLLTRSSRNDLIGVLSLFTTAVALSMQTSSHCMHRQANVVTTLTHHVYQEGAYVDGCSLIRR